MTKCLFFLLVGIPFLQAQTDKIVKTAVQRATVFQQGAQLTASESVYLSAGTTSVIFEHISPSLDPRSILATGKGAFVITKVRFNLKYEEGENAAIADPEFLRLKSEQKKLEDSTEDAIFIRQNIQNKINNLQTERTALTNNKMMRGELQRDSLALFTQSLDFLNQRLNLIDSEALKLERDLKKANAVYERLYGRLTAIRNALSKNYPQSARANQSVPQIIVTVQTDAPLTAVITLSYFVAQAGWMPSYDLVTSKESSNIELKHRAAVFQNTGVDWKDVQLTLSTGDPNQNNTRPVLTPFYIDFDRQETALNEMVVIAKSKKRGQNNLSNREMEDQANDSRISNFTANFPDSITNHVSVSANILRIEYEIKLKYTINSDNKPHNVVIQNKTVPAIFTYFASPKLDSDVMLIARITDWESLNLTSGVARVYADDAYIGETVINPQVASDTLQLNLGRDKSMVVTRTKIKDKSKEKILSDLKYTTKAYEILARNTKSVPVRMIIEDQAPVTKQTDIKIDYPDTGGALFNPATGKLIWDFTLKPKETRRLNFGYEVKYPKDKSLSNL